MELHGKAVDTTSLEFGDFDYREENPYLEWAQYTDGEILGDSELNMLEDKFAAELHMIYMNQL